jgi:hypothetical protein
MEKIHCFIIEDEVVKVHTEGLPVRGDKAISHHFENVAKWKAKAYGILNIDELDSIVGSSKNFDLKKSIEEKKEGIYNVSDQGFVFESSKRCACTLLKGPSKECLAAGKEKKIPYTCVRPDLNFALVSFIPQPSLV